MPQQTPKPTAMHASNPQGLLRVKKCREVNQRASVQAHNNLLPIPQGEIDKNIGAKLVQNPGY